MSNKGGCSHQYPGIGEVAYVKDLMTGDIATRNFRCSRFGGAMSPGLGWVLKLLLFESFFESVTFFRIAPTIIKHSKTSLET